jgi:hypothetical protein
LVDAPLLRKMIDRVTSLPSFADNDPDPEVGERVWRQSDWMTVRFPTPRDTRLVITEQGIVGDVSRLKCGSAACLAGETVLERAPVGTIITPDAPYEVELPDGTEFSIFQLATDYLGLKWAQADALFHGGNTAEGLHRIAENIIAEDDGLV